MLKKSIGDKIQVNENEILGTPASMSTIREITDYGYIVHIDGDDPEWDGPIDFNGNILNF